MRILEFLTDWRSYLIGVLTGVVVVLVSFIYFQGSDYRRVASKSPLSVKETVGTLPNGKVLERIVIPYRGRFHYVYITDDVTTVNKTSVNGRTTNEEATVFLNDSGSLNSRKKMVDKK